MTRPVTVRSGSNVAVAIAVWLFCLVALVDGIVRGSAEYILHDVLVVAAASVAAWMIFFRPRLVIDDHGLRLINLARSYRIPFESLLSWKVGGVLVVEVRIAEGRIRNITSWGAPGVRKQRPALSSALGRSRGPVPHPAGLANADLRSVTEIAVEQRESEWRRTHRSVPPGIARAQWNWLPPAIVAALIIIRVAVG